MANGRALLMGGMQGLQSQMAQRQAANQQIQQMILQAQIQRQIQGADPSRILSELELMNIVNQMRQGGQFPQGGQPPIQPQGQIPGVGTRPPIIPVQGRLPTGRVQPQVAPKGAVAARPPSPTVPRIRPTAPPTPPTATFGAGVEAGLPPRTEQFQTGISKYGVPEFKEQLTPEYKAALDIETNWKKEVLKNKKTAMESFNAVSGLLQNTVAVWKAAAQEKEERGVPAGFASKHAGKVVEGLDLAGFPHTKAYPGQLIETAMAMSKIITGGSRIIRSVINKLIQTFPTDNRRPKDMQAKISQTFRNSFTRAMSRSLTKEEMRYIDNELADLLATPPATIPEAGARIVPPRIMQVGGKEYRVPIEEMVDFINSPEFRNLEMYDVTER